MKVEPDRSIGSRLSQYTECPRKKLPLLSVTAPNDLSGHKIGKVWFELLSFDAKTTTKVLTKNWSLLYSFKISGMAKNQGVKFLLKWYTLLHIKIRNFHSFQPIHKFRYEF